LNTLVALQLNRSIHQLTQCIQTQAATQDSTTNTGTQGHV